MSIDDDSGALVQAIKGASASVSLAMVCTVSKYLSRNLVAVSTVVSYVYVVIATRLLYGMQCTAHTSYISLFHPVYLGQDVFITYNVRRNMFRNFIFAPC